MAFDPSIISAIPDMGPNPVKAEERAIGIKEGLDRSQLMDLQLGEQRTQAKERRDVDAILKRSDYSSPEGLAKTAQEVNRVSPRAAMDLMKTGQSYQSGQVQAQLDQLTLFEKRQDLIVNAIDPIVAQARTMKNAGASDLEVRAFISKEMPTTLQNLRSQKLSDGKPALPDDVLKMATSVPYTLETLEGWEAKSKQGAAAIKQRKEQFVAETQAKKESNDEKRLDETERHNRATEDRQDKGRKAPAGFEWDPEKPDELRPIKGGPKDPNSKPWSGREKVFAERIMASASEASLAIKNITELPVEASSGILGRGHEPTGLISSTFAALKNEMTSQDVQDYKTMLAGVKRNLATIETMGLAASGALTESFGALELQAGDSQITKLRKLAEMRQIVERGLDVPLADPAIPDVLKDRMRAYIQEVSEAVPYTQHDVTALQRAGKKNPDITLEALIGTQGLRPKSPPAADGKPPASPEGAPKAAGGGSLAPGQSYRHASGATVEILSDGAG